MKINLAQQNQAPIFLIGHVSAHPMPVTPSVKSAKTRAPSFNGASRKASSAKVADPACYNSASTTQESKMKSHDELFEEGNAAYHAGQTLATNPYERGGMMWCAWREGWRWGEAHSE